MAASCCRTARSPTSSSICHTLENLSRVARDEYGLAGAVQHGASTLPDAAFHHFPRTETAEIHLATNFQNMLYDHLPDALREEIYAWLRVQRDDERKPTDTDEQFFYKTRKKALGPFKRAVWDLAGRCQGDTGGARTTRSSRSCSSSSPSGIPRPWWPRTCKSPAMHRPAPGTRVRSTSTPRRTTPT